jgi:hypothetical protein
MALTLPAPRLLPHGGTALILGSGPSLTREDVRYARRHVALTIAVNDSYLYAPDAEVLYAGDGSWWRHHHMCRAPYVYQGHRYPAFTGRLRVSLTGIGSLTDPDLLLFRQGPQTGLSLNPHKLATGKNSCYQAINLAVHLGATSAVLLGVDMRAGTIVRDSATRQTDHFFGRHIDDTKPPYVLCLQRFATLVQPLAEIGFPVVNCTPGSALTCFPMQPLAEWVAGATQVKPGVWVANHSTSVFAPGVH